MRKTAATLAVIAVALFAPVSTSAEDACCIGVPYPGLTEEPLCYEGIKILSPISGEFMGCVQYEGGNCLFCEAVVHVGAAVR